MTEIEGEFRAGDLVSDVNAAGAELARGLTAYSSQDAASVAGKQSSESERTLGYIYAEELIHREDMHVFGKAGERDE